MHSAEELQQLFEDELEKLRFDRSPRNLYEPFNYMLNLGGKRVRPVMLLMACEMFGTDAPTAIPQAIAVELFHNFTLMHDDIMDRAPLRRGKQTVHELFGSTLAILSGDAMLVYAYQFLIQTKYFSLEKLISIFNECAIKVCEGQQMDMNFEKTDEVSIGEYLQMIELKTATLFAASLKMGALMGGASETDSQHIYEFGKELGISFQLKDDWLDAFGDAQKTGKEPGGDINQSKKTFLFLKAMQCADGDTKNELLKYFSSWKGTSAKVKMVVKIFRSLQIDRITMDESKKHFSNALEHLGKINVPEKNKLPIKNMTAAIMNRDH